MCERVPIAEQFVRTLDLREVPQYPFSVASLYLGLPESTLRAWFVGTTYGRTPALRTFHPFLTPASHKRLSFFDVASAHVLLALKKKGIPSEDIRGVVESLKKEWPQCRYPLLGHEFFLFGKEVIIKQLGQRLCLNKGRQLGIRVVIDKFLSRLELDADGMPLRFSPLRSLNERGKGVVVIDPNVAGGSPVIRGRGIMVSVIYNRRRSGESERSIAKDLNLKLSEVKQAIDYSKPQDKAAA